MNGRLEGFNRRELRWREGPRLAASESQSRTEGDRAWIWVWVQMDKQQQRLDELVCQNMQPFGRLHSTVSPSRGIDLVIFANPGFTMKLGKQEAA